MCAFLQLWETRHQQVLDDYFNAARIAEEKRMTEWKAAITTQSAWRGYVVRREIKKQSAAATHIQRLFRGWKGRLLFVYALKEKLKRERISLFNSSAIQIQRIWRGFWSRKQFDFYARKRYLENVNKKGQKLREELNQKHAIENAEYIEENVKMNEDKFKTKTAKMHYLVSTSAIPGVYSPQRDKLTNVYIKNQPLEEHIKLNGIEMAKEAPTKFYVDAANSIATQHSITTIKRISPMSPPRERILSPQKSTDKGYIKFPPISPKNPAAIQKLVFSRRNQTITIE